jgi:hypothetical protein
MQCKYVKIALIRDIDKVDDELNLNRSEYIEHISELLIAL